MQVNQRLKSIDALRGFDMLFIMGFAELVAAICGVLPYSWAESLAAQMSHPEWNGFSHHDTIFPLFLFLAGTSFPFSLASSRRRAVSNGAIYKKIIMRAVTLFCLGLIYNGFMSFNFEVCRIHSVLGRIGIAWMIAAIIYMHSSIKWRVAICAATLVGYTLLLGIIPGEGFTLDFSGLTVDNNIVGYVDSLIMPGHLYLEKFDPEGLLSTIPAVVTALLGMFAGDLLRSESLSGEGKARKLLIIGAAMLLGGVITGCFIPTNKSLWSAPFVFYAAAYSYIMLAIFYYIIDVRGAQRWSFFFRVIGLNSILIYMTQMVINVSATNNFLFGGICGLFPEEMHHILFSAGHIALCWSFLYFCYKKEIFLKV